MSTPELGDALATFLGDRPVAVLRGHGLLGALAARTKVDLPRRVWLAVFLIPVLSIVDTVVGD